MQQPQSRTAEEESLLRIFSELVSLVERKGQESEPGVSKIFSGSSVNITFWHGTRNLEINHVFPVTEDGLQGDVDVQHYFVSVVDGRSRFANGQPIKQPVSRESQLFQKLKTDFLKFDEYLRYYNASGNRSRNTEQASPPVTMELESKPPSVESKPPSAATKPRAPEKSKPPTQALELSEGTHYKVKSLKIHYLHHGHKRAMQGGPSKGWHTFKLRLRKEETEVTLHVRGRAGVITNYEGILWRGYQLQLASVPTPPHGIQMVLEVTPPTRR